jgi:methane monooxygenase component A gamma chain
MVDRNGTSARRSARKKATVGAEFRLDASPYGDTSLREEWAAKAENLATLADAVTALQGWRTDHFGFDEQDSLWIEARLEERVAVLRFDSMTDTEIRSLTLTGENVQEVCADALAHAEAAGTDFAEIERINDGFRFRFKPPIMPTNDFMRTEMMLAETLIKKRSLNWFDQSLTDLRAERGVIVHAAPAEV